MNFKDIVGPAVYDIARIIGYGVFAIAAAVIALAGVRAYFDAKHSMFR